MQTKLTLRIDDKLIDRAKRQAKNTGKSLSQFVSDYFSATVTKKKSDTQTLLPITQSLLGILKTNKTINEKAEYQKHLEDKYL